MKFPIKFFLNCLRAIKTFLRFLLSRFFVVGSLFSFKLTKTVTLVIILIASLHVL